MTRFNIWYWVLMLCPFSLMAQVSSEIKPCNDYVHLKDGSKLHGTLISYDPAKGVVLKLNSGSECSLGMEKIKKVIQDCGQDSQNDPGMRLREKGLFIQSSLSGLLGRSAWGDVSLGSSIKVGLYHPVNQWLALGAGAGAEIYTPEAHDEVINYPLFGEMILNPGPRNFFTVAAGYSLTGNKRVQDWSREIYDIDGGLFLAAAIGYRMGNHFSVTAGYQLVQKRKKWNSLWNVENHGYDQFTHKRFSFGLIYTL